MIMDSVQTMTRSDAIGINRKKTSESILLYIDKRPIYDKDIHFISKTAIKSNTFTFVSMNRANIAFGNSLIEPNMYLNPYASYKNQCAKIVPYNKKNRKGEKNGEHETLDEYIQKKLVDDIYTYLANLM